MNTVDTAAGDRAQVASMSRVRYMVQIAMLGAIALILMLFEFPLPFAPAFYKIDLSEVPVLIGCFAMGPLAGAAIEFLKIILHLLMFGTMTAFVGEIANFFIGCAFVLPAALIYKYVRTRRGAIIGMVSGTVIMTVVGCFVNAYVLLPAYAAAFSMPLDSLVEMGTAINSNIHTVTTLVILCVAPFNLLKGVVVSVIVFVIYKKISPLLKTGGVRT